MRPEITYPTCGTWQLSVPAIGFTASDQRHPGSKVAFPTVTLSRVTTSILPLSKERTSSGAPSFLPCRLPADASMQKTPFPQLLSTAGLESKVNGAHQPGNSYQAYAL